MLTNSHVDLNLLDFLPPVQNKIWYFKECFNCFRQWNAKDTGLSLYWPKKEREKKEHFNQTINQKPFKLNS